MGRNIVALLLKATRKLGPASSSSGKGMWESPRPMWAHIMSSCKPPYSSYGVATREFHSSTNTMNDGQKSNSQGLDSFHANFSKPTACISSTDNLLDFICSGPLMDKLGITSEKVAEGINEWLEHGVHLCRLLHLDVSRLSVHDKTRIYHFYIPVFLWCEDQISLHRSKFVEGDEIPPLMIGISAPQGSGKTTLVFALDHLFKISGRKSATLSIDDFYLTAEEQATLKTQNPGNSLLELRGNAGSHDLAFSIETLANLRKLTKEGRKMKLPRYDKSAYQGRGDRADPSLWPDVEGPLTVILFEGWMLGFKRLPNDTVRAVDPQLEAVNKHLEAYFDAWEVFIESWILIKILDANYVYEWRLEAERAMRANGIPGMSDEEVMDFVSRYMPAYKAYLPRLYAEGPKKFDHDRLLVIEIDKGRNPVAQA